MEIVPFRSEHLVHMNLERGAVYEALMVDSRGYGFPFGLHVNDDFIIYSFERPLSEKKVTVHLPPPTEIAFLLPPSMRRDDLPLREIQTDHGIFFIVPGLPGFIGTTEFLDELKRKDSLGTIALWKYRITPLLTILPEHEWHPICRGHFHILEAMICLTRKDVASAEKHLFKARDLAPESLAYLIERLEFWRRKIGEE